MPGKAFQKIEDGLQGALEIARIGAYGAIDTFNNPPTLRKVRYQSRADAEAAIENYNWFCGSERYALAAVYPDGSFKRIEVRP